MGRTSNPGMLVVTGAIALAVLLILLSVTNVLGGGIGYKLAAVTVVVAALMYIFYARANNVEKSGYGALIFIVVIALIIPALLITQQQQQVAATAAQYDLTLQNGAALYGQYCASCHGFQGQGLNAPQLNNNPQVNKYTTDQIINIIAGGIPSDPSNPTVLSMPNWSNRFGGPLTDDDINYLTALIQSSNPAYRKQNNLEDVNGFSYVLMSLTNPTQIAQYHEQAKSGGKPPASQFVDMTKETKVSIVAMNTPNGTFTYGWQVAGSQYADVIIKVGTTVTWSNTSATVHNVYEGTPSAPGTGFPPSSIIANTPGSTYSYTFTKVGDFPFFCAIHPAMIGYIEVVAS